MHPQNHWCCRKASTCILLVATSLSRISSRISTSFIELLRHSSNFLSVWSSGDSDRLKWIKIAQLYRTSGKIQKQETYMGMSMTPAPSEQPLIKVDFSLLLIPFQFFPNQIKPRIPMYEKIPSENLKFERKWEKQKFC